MALKMHYIDEPTERDEVDAYWTITTAQQNIKDLNGVVVMQIFRNEAAYRAGHPFIGVKSFPVPQEPFIPILMVLKQGGSETAYSAIYAFLKGYKEGAAPVAGLDGVVPPDTRPLFFASATDA